jgi:hypothetical protein
MSEVIRWGDKNNGGVYQNAPLHEADQNNDFYKFKINKAICPWGGEYIYLVKDRKKKDGKNFYLLEDVHRKEVKPAWVNEDDISFSGLSLSWGTLTAEDLK